MGNSFFSVVQYGGEATRGTAVAATKIWPGQANFKLGSDVKPTLIQEQMNVRTLNRRAVAYQKLYRNNLMSAHTTFSQLLFPLSCGLKGSVTASEQTSSQADFKWTFTPSLTAANSPESATIELGDDVQFWETEYCMFDKISLSGSIDQEGGDAPVALDASFFGRQLTTTTKTAGLSLPATGDEIMNAKLARLYADTAWAGIGSTELTNLLRSFQIEILTGVHPDSTGSANKYFNVHKEGIIDVMATFTIEAGTTANTLLGLQQTPTFRAFRLAINGSQIGSGTVHNLTIDFGGFIETIDPISSEDRGDNLATFAVRGTYDTTGAKMLQLTVTTNTNAWK
jgi:hypothetical protein